MAQVDIFQLSHLAARSARNINVLLSHGVYHANAVFGVRILKLSLLERKGYLARRPKSKSLSLHLHFAPPRAWQNYVSAKIFRSLLFLGAIKEKTKTKQKKKQQQKTKMMKQQQQRVSGDI